MMPGSYPLIWQVPATLFLLVAGRHRECRGVDGASRKAGECRFGDVNLRAIRVPVWLHVRKGVAGGAVLRGINSFETGEGHGSGFDDIKNGIAGQLRRRTRSEERRVGTEC